MKKILVLILGISLFSFTTSSKSTKTINEKNSKNYCDGVKLVEYWTKGGGNGIFEDANYSVYVRVRNNTNQTKIVYFEIKDKNSYKWIKQSKTIKVYPNDIADKQIGYLSNYGGKVRIHKCQ